MTDKDKWRITFCFYMLAILVVVGLIFICNQTRYGEKALKTEFERGVRYNQREACELGLGKYQNDQFSWNTNVIDSLVNAVNVCVESEKRQREFAVASIKAMKMTMSVAEIMRKLEENNEPKIYE